MESSWLMLLRSAAVSAAIESSAPFAFTEMAAGACDMLLKPRRLGETL